MHTTDCTHSHHCIVIANHSSMRTFPRPLPSPPLHPGSTCDVISSWMQDVKGANDDQVSLILAFLNEDYLRLVLLYVGFFFARDLSGWRHWFHVFTAWVPGWQCRRDEGHPLGFPLRSIST